MQNVCFWGESGLHRQGQLHNIRKTTRLQPPLVLYRHGIVTDSTLGVSSRFGFKRITNVSQGKNRALSRGKLDLCKKKKQKNHIATEVPEVPAMDERFTPACRSFAFKHGGLFLEDTDVYISLGNGSRGSSPWTPSRPQGANVEHGTSAALRV